MTHYFKLKTAEYREFFTYSMAGHDAKWTSAQTFFSSLLCYSAYSGFTF